ncbi:MAG: hypothetical protein AAB466_05720 [Verrucomicrobiota bacterium]
MSKQRNVLKLGPDEQDSWLNQHLPNRVGAAWVCLPAIKGEWEWKRQRPLQPGDFAENADGNQVWCICRAVEHGQKAAMRWLIEFVGIYRNEAGKPDRPRRRPNDVSIQSFVADGSEFQVILDTADPSSMAMILADVWMGCTQSCVHSTFRTNHPSADPPELAKAFTIIVEHLQAKLYGPRGGNRLSQIVRGQH